MKEKAKDTSLENNIKPKVGIKGYVALIAALLIFSGLLMKVQHAQFLSAFDYTTLIGKFGTMKNAAKDTFVGVGGDGARGGFLFALSLAPSIMLAIGILDVLTHYGAIKAAHKLLTPLLRPILGVPGLTGLALITDLQSTDAGAALTKDLYDKNLISRKELTIITAWQYSGAGMISNFFAIGSALFASLTVPLILPLGVIFILKFIGGALCRLALNTIYKGDFENESK